MGVSRRHAAKRIRGLTAQVEVHVAKMRLEPTSIDYNHWRREVESLISQVEQLAKHLGRRSEVEVMNRVAQWKAITGSRPAADD